MVVELLLSNGRNRPNRKGFLSSTRSLRPASNSNKITRANRQTRKPKTGTRFMWVHHHTTQQSTQDIHPAIKHHTPPTPLPITATITITHHHQPHPASPPSRPSHPSRTFLLAALVCSILATFGNIISQPATRQHGQPAHHGRPASQPR